MLEAFSETKGEVKVFNSNISKTRSRALKNISVNTKLD